MYRILFNPSYMLRQDGNRVIIMSIEDYDESAEEWFSFIHPYHAMMFSFFKGQKEAIQEIKECAEFFQITFEKMKEVLKPYVNNDKWFGVSDRNGNHVNFPRNVLRYTCDNTIIQERNYTAKDFSYIGEPDYNTIRLNYPVSIIMELTMKCYTNCQYCYAKRNNLSQKVMDMSTAIDFIHQAKKDGVLNIDINGGEVFLHPNIKEILKVLVDNGFHPLISTKMPVDSDMLDYVKALGIPKIQISLDSVNPSTLQNLLGVKQDYINRLTQTFEYLNKISLKTDINVVLTTYNINKEEITQLLDFISNFNVIKHIRFNACGYSLYNDSFRKLCPSIEKLKWVENFLNEARESYENISIAFSSYESCDDYTFQGKKDSFPERAICTGNTRNAVILPNGDVTICEELYDHPTFVLGNIKTMSLKKIWLSPKALSLFQKGLKDNSDSICNGCKEYRECRNGAGVCWKSILMAYGMDNWDYPDPRCPKAPYPYHIFYAERSCK